MFFDFQLLSYQRKGKFAVCWLAATRGIKAVKKHEIMNTKIVALCNELIQYLTSSSAIPKHRFSLSLGAKLVNGTVKIYREQAIYLEDEIVRFLTIVRKPIIIADSQSTAETPEEPVPKPKRKRAVRDVEEEQELITIEQLQQALQLTEVRAEAITLREEMPRAIQEEFGGFGEIGCLEGIPPEFQLLQPIPAREIPQPQPVAAPRPEVVEVQIEPPPKRRKTERQPEIVIEQVPVEPQVDVVPQEVAAPVDVQPVEVVQQPVEVVQQPLAAPIEEVQPTQVVEEQARPVLSLDIPPVPEEEPERPAAPIRRAHVPATDKYVKQKYFDRIFIDKDFSFAKAILEYEKREVRELVKKLAINIVVVNDLPFQNLHIFAEDRDMLDTLEKLPLEEGSKSSIRASITSLTKPRSQRETVEVQPEMQMPEIAGIPQAESTRIVPAPEGIPAVRPEVEEETPQVIPSAIQEVTEARTLEVSAVAAGFRQPSPPISVAPAATYEPSSPEIRQIEIMRILQGWNYKTDEYPTIEDVCRRPINRLNIAVAFNDLLVLSKILFVELVPEEDSLTLNYIKPGQKFPRQ